MAKKEISPERTSCINKDVCLALCEILEKYTVEGNVPLDEIVAGTALGYVYFLNILASVIEPKLNPDGLIKGASELMVKFDNRSLLNDIEKGLIEFMKGNGEQKESKV